MAVLDCRNTRFLTASASDIAEVALAFFAGSLFFFSGTSVAAGKAGLPASREARKVKARLAGIGLRLWFMSTSPAGYGYQER